ncbi:MAG TPA: hypothetical protein VMT29_23285 [Steroidobacteraceae bacterium]|nr:hypothetical protein [Steroidobacteraceae bacterium]
MKRLIRSAANRVLAPLASELSLQQAASTQAAQHQLAAHYAAVAAAGKPLPRFEDAGFRVFSQTDQDGLLVYIFALIGTTNRLCVELAFGTPFGANTTNLICNWGWHGVLLEADPALVDGARAFFARHPDTWVFPPAVHQAWVTAENINDILRIHGMAGDIDLLSLDIDGVDYWVWKAVDAVRPRVVVVEFQDMWGAQRAVTVPYDPSFARGIHADFFGASLAAFVKLGRQKGYRLVGANRYGYNAFFVRDDIVAHVLAEVEPQACLRHPKVEQSQRERLPAVRDLGWVEV